jgi:two-component system sensor histidine kinase KdpD
MDSALTPQNRHELMQTILQESERLNRFVQNLLDMTKLGHGSLELRREWCGDIRDILGRATSRLQRELHDFNVEYRIDDDISNLYVDPVLFEQVIVNILENCSKYAEHGTRILISMEKDGSKALLKVADQGQGIPELDREKIFDMFYRVRAGDSKIAGTGLGLAICRGLVEAHGGTIHAESGYRGKGTVIVISMPMIAARPKTFYHGDQPSSPFTNEEKDMGEQA